MIENPPDPRTVEFEEMRAHLSDLLDRVQRHQEHVVVEENGVPLVAVISAEEYDEYRRLLAAKAHTELARAVGAEAERQGLTEETLLRELRLTRGEVFDERYGRHSR